MNTRSYCVTPSFTNTLKHEQLRDIMEDMYPVNYAIRLLLTLMTCVFTSDSFLGELNFARLSQDGNILLVDSADYKTKTDDSAISRILRK